MTRKLFFEISCIAALAFAWSVNALANIKAYAEKFVIAPGETRNVTLCLDCDSACYRGFQMDITLPAGLTLAQADTTDSTATPVAVFIPDSARLGMGRNIIFRQIDNNRYRVVCYSMTNAPINGTSGPLASIRVTAADSAVNPDTIAVSAIGFANSANVTEHVPDASMPAVYRNPLARVLAQGNDEKEFVVADTLAIAAHTAKGFAFVTDRHDNWLKIDLTDGSLAQFLDLGTIAPGTLVGTLSSADVNPTFHLSTMPEANESQLSVEPRLVRLGDLDSTGFSAKPNEVLTLAGRYFATDDGNRLFQYTPTSNQKGAEIDINMDWSSNHGDLVYGNWYTLPVVMQLHEAWDSVPDTTANYCDNYVAFPLKVPIVTEVEDNLADKNIKVTAHNGLIAVAGAENADVAVFAADGRLVARGKRQSFAVSPGVYVVTIGNKAFKITAK